MECSPLPYRIFQTIIQDEWVLVAWRVALVVDGPRTAKEISQLHHYNKQFLARSPSRGLSTFMAISVPLASVVTRQFTGIPSVRNEKPILPRLSCQAAGSCRVASSKPSYQIPILGISIGQLGLERPVTAFLVETGSHDELGQPMEVEMMWQFVSAPFFHVS